MVVLEPPVELGRKLYDSYPTFARDIILGLVLFIVSVSTYLIVELSGTSGVLLVRPAAGFFILISSFIIGFASLTNSIRFRIYEFGLIARTYTPRGDHTVSPAGKNHGKHVVLYRDIHNIYPATRPSKSGTYHLDLGMIITTADASGKLTCCYLAFSGGQMEKLVDVANTIKERMRGDWNRKYRSTQEFFEICERYDEPRIRPIVEYFLREYETLEM